MAEFIRKNFKFQLPKFNRKPKTDNNRNEVQLEPVNAGAPKKDDATLPIYKSPKRMPLFRPCFGYGLKDEVPTSEFAQKNKLASRGPSLKGAVKMIAVINAILAFVLLLDLVIAIVLVALNNGSLKDVYQKIECTIKGVNKYFYIYSSNIKYIQGDGGEPGGCKSIETEAFDVTMYYRIFNLLYWIASGVLARVLFKAASERNRPSIMVWATAEVILFVFWACFTIVKEAVMLQATGFANLQYLLVVFLIPILFKLYSYWVIYCFVKELKDSDQVSPWTESAKLKPTEAPEAQPVDVHFVEYTSKPWPQNKEIDPQNLKVEHFIARGIHGSVFRAVLESIDVQTGEAMPSAYVAVKKIRLDMENENYEAILNELKIMSYIGTHPNVVNLIGACTTKISERKLDIVLEYCPYPNLLDFVKTNRGFFKNQLQRGGLYGTFEMEDEVPAVYSTLAEIAISKGANLELVTTRDLVQWAIEIATGMQFLHSKKILHADLALRNVLLSNERVAKITDFGFSQSLYSAAKPYIPQKLSDLPWRWMAPEALEFDTKRVLQLESDNWSYGVTLFELFSLGEPPHPRQRFNRAFVARIKVMPLEMPAFVPREIYDHVMRRCWALHPAKRISWPEIIEELAIALRNLTRPQHPPPQQDQPPKPIVYVAPSEKIYYSSIEEEPIQEKSYVAVLMKHYRPDGSFIMVEEMRPLASANGGAGSMRKSPGGSSNTASTAAPSRASESFTHHPPARNFEATSSGSFSHHSGKGLHVNSSGSFSNYPGRRSEGATSSGRFSNYPETSSASSSFSKHRGTSPQHEGLNGGGSFSNHPTRGATNVFRTPAMPMSPATSPTISRPYMNFHDQITAENRFSKA